MHSHSEKKILDFSARQLFELVLDVEKYPEFLPWCSKVKLVKILDENNFHADLTVNFKAFDYTYTSLITKYENDEELRVDVKVIKGPFKSLNNSWKFIDLKDGTCQVEFDIDLEMNNFFLNKILKFIFDSAYKMMVQSFEKRARQVYKKT
jgi:coenzyme Q-binding protein COQ10